MQKDTPALEFPAELASRYAKVRVVGSGTFGQAILVRETSTGNFFIAKEMDLRKMTNQDRQATETEVMLLRTLTHSTIVRYVDCFLGHQAFYIIMEYADAGDLYQFLSIRRNCNNQYLTEDQVLRIFYQLCEAINFIHSRGIIHRDIKTGNVFLTGRGEVKLGDFGLSCTGRRVDVAETREVCGTPQYYSPEMIQGKPYSLKSDVWALGVVLYELMMLSLPFTGRDFADLGRNICACKYPPVDTSRYSPNLCHLLTKLLAREPGMRPDTKTILNTPIMREVGRKLYPEVPKDPSQPFSQSTPSDGQDLDCDHVPVNPRRSSFTRKLAGNSPIRAQASLAPQPSADDGIPVDPLPAYVKPERTDSPFDVEAAMEEVLSSVHGDAYLAYRDNGDGGEGMTLPSPPTSAQPPSDEPSHFNGDTTGPGEVASASSDSKQPGLEEPALNSAQVESHIASSNPPENEGATGMSQAEIDRLVEEELMNGN